MPVPQLGSSSRQAPSLVRRLQRSYFAAPTRSLRHSGRNAQTASSARVCARVSSASLLVHLHGAAPAADGCLRTSHSQEAANKPLTRGREQATHKMPAPTAPPAGLPHTQKATAVAAKPAQHATRHCDNGSIFTPSIVKSTLCAPRMTRHAAGGLMMDRVDGDCSEIRNTLV
ncbi:uncharacterized protein BDZ99DRAFT_515799 [Mytilinidion resinicola]|uniref:Uncharacterized protein n=1 Tax=Mytilinidion resinicola TaxID=574789 RepID=A0A6A6Z1J6_9PEZI|nr:uncharacterized protein BDZ99DRAFT_515799 [Mytilinidion resinicola]KAF2815042.1 hypothetical protein BDZ99DRAFT_515799 [Mytilinidion resinicola]